MFALQFSKAYFNIGLMFDKESDTPQAAFYYEKAFQKEVALDKPSSCFVKTATNLAVCYEKLG